MQNLSLWLNAGAQITHGGQVQRPRQKFVKKIFPTARLMPFWNILDEAVSQLQALKVGYQPSWIVLVFAFKTSLLTNHKQTGWEETRFWAYVNQ